MRTIKFKAKSLEDGKWNIGDLSHVAHQTLVKNNPCLEGRPIYTFAVDRETVCQFTGLLGKNGKEIYEGDVLRYDKHPFGFIDEEDNMCNNCYGVIVWNKATASFCITTVKKPESSVEDIFEGKIYFIYQDELKNFEVVGNIHESEWRQYGEYIQTKEGKEAEDD